VSGLVSKIVWTRGVRHLPGDDTRLGAEPPLHELVNQLPTVAASASAALLAAWIVIELVRSGPRQFFDEIR
jgi:hypothetical protein